MERIRVELEAEVVMDETAPHIYLRDNGNEGNVIVGDIGQTSVEYLARKYQEDKEYTSGRGKFHYFFKWKGKDKFYQLFQKHIQQGYGEADKIIDKTDNY